MTEGHIELARSVASIRVGHRLRTDLGNLDDLTESIKLQGLLQPITISPDGTLICGVRRYAAVLELGWKTVNVWVRSGISTDLERLLAEQHENTLRKPFTPTEAAGLYAEMKVLYQEDAARRKAATQFHSGPIIPGIAGPADSAGPRGDARAQAARAVTGRRSDFTLEHVLEVQRLAGDPTAPDGLRETAARELEAMDQDHWVNRHYLVVKTAQTAELQQLAAPARGVAAAPASTTSDIQPQSVADREDLAQAAHHALIRAQAARSHGGSSAAPAVREPPAVVAPLSLRAFLLTITETDYWWLHYDPEEIGPALTAVQWDQFEDWVAQSTLFRDTAQRAAQRKPLALAHTVTHAEERA